MIEPSESVTQSFRENSGCYPRYRTKPSAIFFCVAGVLYSIIGILLIIENRKLALIEIDYTSTNCVPEEIVDVKECKDYVHENVGEFCMCDINFTIESSLPGKVYIYYELSNFYQNHRRYGESQNHYQLLGIPISSTTIKSKCEPYYMRQNKVIAPCGAIANSMFNDSFWLFYLKEDRLINVTLKKTGIAWDTEKGRKYKNPASFRENREEAFAGTINPPNWQKNIYELDTDVNNNGYENEDLIVWMKTAPFSRFRKLHRIVDEVGDFVDGLPKGNYLLKIKYAYPTWHYNGRKKVIIGNVTWFGGRNAFLGVISCVLGILMIVVAIFYLSFI